MNVKVSERPDLMEKWAFAENEALGILHNQITTGSGKKACWRCIAKHHLYQRPIDKEASRNLQCPACKKENQKYLSDYPELLKEFAYDLNDHSPDGLTAGSDIAVNWRCEKHGHVWPTTPYHRIKEKTGCPVCLNKKVLQGFNDLLTVNPPYLRYWDYDKNDKDGILASNYTPVSTQKAWWFCDKGHHTYDSITRVMDRKKTHCSECLKEIKQRSVDIAIEKKKRGEAYAKKQADAKSKRESMKLDKQNAIMENRKKKMGIAVPLAQFWDYDENQKKKMAISVSLAQFWDYDENQKRGFKLEDISAQRAFSWKCSNGHKWKADLAYMLQSNLKCPECFVEENSISRKYPYLADIYNIEMNRGIPPEKCLAVAGKYYWWTCQRGHTYIATLVNAAKHKKTGCMYCDVTIHSRVSD